MRAINNKQIAGRINRFKTALANFSQEAYGMGRAHSREAEAAIDECKTAIKEIRELVATDPVFSNDLPTVDLPNYYENLLRHAKSSSSIAEEVIEYLSEDEEVFAQDYEDGMTYRRKLKELGDRRM